MPPGLKQKGRKRGPGPWWDQPCRPTSSAPEGFRSRSIACFLNVSINSRAGVGAGVLAQRSAFWHPP